VKLLLVIARRNDVAIWRGPGVCYRHHKIKISKNLFYLSLLLYINGQRLDLEPGQQIAQTKQVNDLNSLDDRQANFTNKFKVPKTANNIKIMQFLTFPGNNSPLPYRENRCSLYGESGECFIYKGRAVVTDGGDSYDVVVYDGIIDLYKAIENRSLGEVITGELDHFKDVQTVKQSMANSSGNAAYTYILADYNGKTGNTNSAEREVEIDYLMPSINVKWLWDRIFQHFNCSYSGAVFQTEAFKNLWMTYPKGMTNSEGNIVCFEASQYQVYNQLVKWKQFSPICISTDELNPDYIVQGTSNHIIKVSQSGTYRLDVFADIKINKIVQLKVGFNNDNPVNTTGYNSSWNNGSLMLSDFVVNDVSYNFTRILNLNAYESIFLFIERRFEDVFHFHVEQTELTVKLTKVNANEISFASALADFSIKDFLNEVVHRFGLTMYKRKYEPHYDFLTLQEVLQTGSPADWSGKFVKIISENYIYGSYARQNWFRYNYNDKEASHNDGYIEVGNVNLPDSKEIIKSKIYSPEREHTQYLGRQGNLYKLWDKEAVDDAAEGEEPFKYKALDKRYYFLKKEYVTPAIPVTLKSETLAQADTAWAFNAESYFKLKFADIIRDYYTPVSQILDKSVVVTAEMFLTEADVANLDFKKLYYIKQLSNYYIINKINNYVPGKPVKCELVRVLYDPVPDPVLPITITKVIVEGHDMRVYFNLDIMAATVNLQILNYGSQGVWSNSTMGAEHNPRYFNFTPTGTFRIRLEALGNISNEVEVTIPSNTTIEP
jgi:hypothetical protein